MNIFEYLLSIITHPVTCASSADVTVYPEVFKRRGPEEIRRVPTAKKNQPEYNCFGLNSRFTRLVNNEPKIVYYSNIQKALNKGEKVFLLGKDNEYHEVLLMTITNKKATFQKIGNLVISDWHPIFYNGEWTFPIHISKETEKVTGYVNFQIEGGIIDVDGVKCVGLAHYITNNKVTNHEFYGTNNVIDSLRKIYGYTTNVMVTDNLEMKRGEDKLVCDFYLSPDKVQIS